MGLDQYLYAKQYLSPSQWLGAEKNAQYEAVINAVNAGSIVTKDMPSAQVEVKIGYWRKENAIHQFFVDNCQDGVDDCRESYVSRETLKELRARCVRVLADHSLADEELPTQSGFFFGSTEYDEWYFGGLEDTIAIIDGALALDDTWSIFYQSSW